MAYDGIEVELKVMLEPREAESLARRLSEIGERVDARHQVDDYYSPVTRSFLDAEFPFEWLSLRARDGKSVLNYKHFHPEGAEKHTHCDEWETEVDRPDELERILDALGISRVVRVEKRRTTYRLPGFEIALDEVVDLGDFIEIEATIDQGGVDETREALLRLASDLGLRLEETDLRGYPYQLLARMGLVK